jgi:hypothetical protein
MGSGLPMLRCIIPNCDIVRFRVRDFVASGIAGIVDCILGCWSEPNVILDPRKSRAAKSKPPVQGDAA